VAFLSSKDKTKLYAIFHLNLAFSSIEEEQHASVIKECYWPLLKLVKNHGFPLGIELSVYTLECIAKHDQTWINTLRQLALEKKCDVLACGDSQVIGPLVPAIVNRKNLDLGLAGYEEYLGVIPALAYVNEQAVSASLLDIYIDAGFKAVVIEWDNPYSHNPEWQADYLFRPQTLKAASGRSIPVIWNHAISFQKFQRYAHGEYNETEHLEYLEKSIPSSAHSFSIYGNDAEIFNYRPGRFKTEAKIELDEWERIQSLFITLSDHSDYLISLPSHLVDDCSDGKEALTFTNAAFPISVKKQAKYNINRWAVSGRNDLQLNTQCFSELHQATPKTDGEWKTHIRSWASDYRTHLTEKRFTTLPTSKSRQTTFKNIEWSSPSENNTGIEHDQDRKRLYISNQGIQLSLNTYRGLSIDSLAFAEHEFKPIIGTLAHGHFDHIQYAADFYSNHCVIERYRERDRITDLQNKPFTLGNTNNKLVIKCETLCELGIIQKYYFIGEKSVRCRYEFSFENRPESSFRLGYMTLKDCSARPWYAAHLGGEKPEYFEAQNDFDHGSPVSALISSNSAISATESICYFGSNDKGIKLTWDKTQCAALAMASSKQIRAQYFNRMWFSLVEVDDTLKAGGQLPNFEFTISAAERRDAKH